MKHLVIILSGLLASSCTLGEINSIHRTASITGEKSQIVDAKQRFVLTYPKTSKRKHKVACAEPSPDVFSVYAASGEAAFDKGDVGASGSFSSAETGASLIERTTSLQALRDAYFRLCEAYAIGAIDEIDYMIGQRHNQTALMGLLAIEEMNAIARAPAVVIGGSAGAASASGIQRITTSIVTLNEENGVLEIANKNDGDAVTQKQAEKKGIQDGEGAEEKRAKLQGEIDNLQKEIEKRTTKINANNKAIAALEKSLENAGATGSFASSSMPLVISGGDSCNENCRSDRSQIAKEMVNVVKELNGNDFGPTICLSYFRRKIDASNKSSTTNEEYMTMIEDVCSSVLQAYAVNLAANAGIKVMFAQALQSGEFRREEMPDLTATWEDYKALLESESTE